MHRTAPTTGCSASPISRARVIEGRAPRASGDLALHVLEVMEAILRAGETGTAQAVPGMIRNPPS